MSYFHIYCLCVVTSPGICNRNEVVSRVAVVEGLPDSEDFIVFLLDPGPEGLDFSEGHDEES